MNTQTSSYATKHFTMGQKVKVLNGFGRNADGSSKFKAGSVGRVIGFDKPSGAIDMSNVGIKVGHKELWVLADDFEGLQAL